MFTEFEKRELLTALYQKIGTLENTLSDTKEKLRKSPMMVFLTGNIESLEKVIEEDKKLAEKIKAMKAISE
jgi:hypothetical protein